MAEYRTSKGDDVTNPASSHFNREGSDVSASITTGGGAEPSNSADSTSKGNGSGSGSGGSIQDSRRDIRTGMGVAALILGTGVFLSKIAGFLRDMAIVGLHGATSATDSYFAAFTLPDLLNYMLAGGALSISFVPIFARHLAEKHEDRGWRCFSTTITFMTLAIIILTIAGWIAAPALVSLLVPGFAPETLAQAVKMTRIILPAQIFFISGGIISATLYARKKFTAPALSPLIYNLCIIAGGLLLNSVCGIEGFAWGVLVGAFLGPFAVPLFAVRRSIRYRFSLKIKDSDFIEFIKMTIPLMLGFSLLSVDEWLARYFASEMTGVITHLNNARRLMLVPTGVLSFAAGAAALPFLSQLFAENRFQEMGRTLGDSLRAVAQISIIAAGAMAALAYPMVTIIFGRGKFGHADIQATAALLVFFSAGIGAWGVQGIAVRGFYAMRNTITPMISGSLVVLISVPFYKVLWETVGPKGLPVATSLGMTLTALAALFLLHRKKVDYQPRSLWTVTWRSTLLAGISFMVCAILSRIMSRWLDPFNLPHAVISIIVLGTVYLTIVLTMADRMGLPQINRIWKKVIGRIAGKLGFNRFISARSASSVSGGGKGKSVL